MKNYYIIISLFGSLENINSRAYKVAKAINNDILFITPDFNHALKKYKDINNIIQNDKFKIKYIHVPSYKSNISFKRLISHFIFSIKLFFYFSRLKFKPIALYCLMPPSISAFISGQFCKRNNIPFIIDVIDLWPESLIPVINGNPIIKILLLPWKWITNQSYKKANLIIGESKTYMEIAHKSNPNVPCTYAYLGIDLQANKLLLEESNIHLEKPINQIWICYGGSLGNSYDFENILNALKAFPEKEIDYKMFFVGEGEKRNYIESFSIENNLNLTLTGRVTYKDYLKYLSYCDIGINGFKLGSQVIHSYKFNDYVASGLFIFNNLNGETFDMIEKYKIGKNYSGNSLVKDLQDVCLNWDKYKKYKENLSHLINEELDSNTIYPKLAYQISNIVNK